MPQTLLSAPTEQPVSVTAMLFSFRQAHGLFEIIYIPVVTARSRPYITRR